MLYADTRPWTGAADGKLSGSLISHRDPRSQAAEVFRAVGARLSLRARTAHRPTVVTVASVRAGEGRSTLCANLGVVLAQAGKNVLIIDCDFRKPAMRDLFGLRGREGILEVLGGGCDLRETCREPLPGLKVLTARAASREPDALLDPDRLSVMLGRARDHFDHVLIDSPPLELAASALVLCAQADGVILAADPRKTSGSELRRTVHGLRAAGAVVLEAVANSAPGGRSAG